MNEVTLRTLTADVITSKKYSRALPAAAENISLGSVPAVSAAAIFRIMATYLWRHGRLPNLRRPTLFTELMQLRKLYEHDARMPMLADKVAVKRHVARELGEQWVIPTYWYGKDMPEAGDWRKPYVVKSRHGCKQAIFVHDNRVAPQDIQSKTRRWLNSSYGRWLDEWLYTQIEKGVIVEPFIGKDRELPIDYKFYVFGGRVEYVQVHIERATRHRWIILDRDWQRVSASSGDSNPAQPSALQQMIKAAEQLGGPFTFVRVDFYQPDEQPLFSEMTFYPGSGLDRFDVPHLDHEMGQHWLRAREHVKIPRY